MGAVLISGTSLIAYKSEWRHNSEDHNLQACRPDVLPALKCILACGNQSSGIVAFCAVYNESYMLSILSRDVSNGRCYVCYPFSLSCSSLSLPCC
jgi:hypothetical protein